MEKFTHEVGSLSEVLHNLKRTFFKGQGWLHLLLLISILLFIATFFNKIKFLPNETYGSIDFAGWYVFVPVGIGFGAWFIGHCIERIEEKYYNANYDWNDIWWGIFATPFVFALYLLIPQESFVAARWVCVGLFALLLNYWLVKNKIFKLW